MNILKHSHLHSIKKPIKYLGINLTKDAQAPIQQTLKEM